MKISPLHAEIIIQVDTNGQILGSLTLNWNYKLIPGSEGDGPLDKRVILDIPSTDIATALRYRSLCLNQYNFYRHFFGSITWAPFSPAVANPQIGGGHTITDSVPITVPGCIAPP